MARNNNPVTVSKRPSRRSLQRDVESAKKAWVSLFEQSLDFERQFFDEARQSALVAAIVKKSVDDLKWTDFGVVIREFDKDVGCWLRDKNLVRFKGTSNAVHAAFIRAAELGVELAKETLREFEASRKELNRQYSEAGEALDRAQHALLERELGACWRQGQAQDFNGANISYLLRAVHRGARFPSRGIAHSYTTRQASNTETVQRFETRQRRHPSHRRRERSMAILSRFSACS